jgi:hypothetical protein
MSSSVVGRPRAGSKPSSKRGGQFGEVRVEAEARPGFARIALLDPDHRRHQQPLHLAHRGDEPGALGIVQRGEDLGGRHVGPPVQLRVLGAALVGEAGEADPPVGVARRDSDQFLRLEGPQHPADVPGIQAEAGAQEPDVGAVAAVGTDLPQQPALAERPAPGQERLVERAHALRHSAVEPAHPLHHRLHSLTIVRGLGGVHQLAGSNSTESLKDP